MFAEMRHHATNHRSITILPNTIHTILVSVVKIPHGYNVCYMLP